MQSVEARHAFFTPCYLVDGVLGQSKWRSAIYMNDGELYYPYQLMNRNECASLFLEVTKHDIKNNYTAKAMHKHIIRNHNNIIMSENFNHWPNLYI